MAKCELNQMVLFHLVWVIMREYLEWSRSLDECTLILYNSCLIYKNEK